MDEKILNKIRKVLALTQSPYQEEAQAALLKAQELMMQYGLSMAEVKEDDIETKKVIDDCILQKRRNTWYEKYLAAVIGNNFRCHPYFTPGRGIYFIGLKSDVEIAREVYLYALSVMLFLANEYLKKLKDQMAYKKGIKNDYILGFIYGLERKFKSQVEAKSYALILVKDPLVEEAVNKKNLKNARNSYFVSGGSTTAFDAGYNDGMLFDENRKMICAEGI